MGIARGLANGWVLLLCMGVCAGARAQGASVAEQYLFRAANAERAAKGLSALRWDGALQKAAFEHARQMTARGSISHRYAGEAELAERGKMAGARFSHIAENVAAAQTAVKIHDAWMKSAGHRENLLDARVDAVGISVLQRAGQLYAVQDFAKTTAELSIDAQEAALARTLELAGAGVVYRGTENARRTCELAAGYAGEDQPAFVVRYTSADLAALPQVLMDKLAVGETRAVAVGACAGGRGEPFSVYSFAVMLFR